MTPPPSWSLLSTETYIIKPPFPHHCPRGLWLSPANKVLLKWSLKSVISDLHSHLFKPQQHTICNLCHQLVWFITVSLYHLPSFPIYFDKFCFVSMHRNILRILMSPVLIQKVSIGNDFYCLRSLPHFVVNFIEFNETNWAIN